MTDTTSAASIMPKRFLKETKGDIPNRIVIEGWIDDVCLHSETVEYADAEAARERARKAIRPVTI